MTRSVTLPLFIACAIAFAIASTIACGGTIGDPDVEPDARPRTVDASPGGADAAPDAAPMIVPAPCDSGGDARAADVLTGNCYVRFDQLVTWVVASQSCEADGGHLVSIASAAEEAVMASIAPSNVDLWMGANDLAAETVWAWDNTGEPFAFTNWRAGEPNDGNGGPSEDCAVFEGDTLEWDDRDCAAQVYTYFCEREATLQ